MQHKDKGLKKQKSFQVKGFQKSPTIMRQYSDEDLEYVGLTLDKMACLERTKIDIKPEDYFYTKLNDIFETLLGPTIRREFNYFKSPDFLEEKLLRNLNSVNEEELWDYSIKICRKDPEKRLFEEVIILQKITESNEAMKLIRKIKGRKVMYECAKNLRYKYGKVSTYLLKPYEYIKHMTIVLKGILQVKQVDKKEEITEKNITIQNENEQLSTITKSSFQDNLAALHNRPKNCILHRGMSFGDINILTQEESSTIGDIEIQNDSWQYQFEESSRQQMNFPFAQDERELLELQKEIREFGSMNFLQLMEQWSIKTLFLRSKVKTFYRNNVVAKQHQKIEYIYFVKEGEVKITHDLHYEPEIPLNKQTVDFEQTISGEKLQKLHITTKPFDVSILTKGKSIGLFEYFRDEPFSSSCTVQSQTAQLYSLSKKDFSIVLSMDKRSKQKMIDLLKTQEGQVGINQERIKNYNSFYGVEDINTKEQEEDLKKKVILPKNIINEDDKNVMRKSNVNLNFTVTGMGNLDYILSQIKRPRISRKDKVNEKYISQFKLNEEQLKKINKVVFEGGKFKIEGEDQVEAQNDEENFNGVDQDKLNQFQENLILDESIKMEYESNNIFARQSSSPRRLQERNSLIRKESLEIYSPTLQIKSLSSSCVSPSHFDLQRSSSSFLKQRRESMSPKNIDAAVRAILPRKSKKQERESELFKAEALSSYFIKTDNNYNQQSPKVNKFQHSLRLSFKEGDCLPSSNIEVTSERLKSGRQSHLDLLKVASKGCSVMTSSLDFSSSFQNRSYSNITPNFENKSSVSAQRQNSKQRSDLQDQSKEYGLFNSNSPQKSREQKFRLQEHPQTSNTSSRSLSTSQKRINFPLKYHAAQIVNDTQSFLVNTHRDKKLRPIYQKKEKVILNNILNNNLQIIGRCKNI